MSKQNKENTIKDVQKKVKDVTVSTGVSKNRTKYITSTLIVLTLSFIVLSGFARVFPYFELDLAITKLIQTITFEPFAWLMQFTSALGFAPQVYFIFGSILAAIYLMGLKWQAVVGLFSATTVTAINFFLKTLIGRERPTNDLVEVVTHLSEFSFPSGHVMLYATFFGYLFFVTYITLVKGKIRRILLFVWLALVILIGPSRIYLGAHWASDVLGAYIFGAIWLIVTIYVYNWGKKRFFVQSVNNK
jgi:undecaprenyl-diphosphatase